MPVRHTIGVEPWKIQELLQPGVPTQVLQGVLIQVLQEVVAWALQAEAVEVLLSVHQVEAAVAEEALALEAWVEVAEAEVLGASVPEVQEVEGGIKLPLFFTQNKY